jgi:hypothetical protein
VAGAKSRARDSFGEKDMQFSVDRSTEVIGRKKNKERKWGCQDEGMLE